MDAISDTIKEQIYVKNYIFLAKVYFFHAQSNLVTILFVVQARIRTMEFWVMLPAELHRLNLFKIHPANLIDNGI